MRLLIVEDNAAMRKAIRKVVAEPRDVVMECSDGDEAVSAYDQFRPDWVLMDYEMKRMDGITATAEILKFDPEAKVLVVSQHNDADIRDAALGSGAIRFISKEQILSLKKFISLHGGGIQ